MSGKEDPWKPTRGNAFNAEKFPLFRLAKEMVKQLDYFSSGNRLVIQAFVLPFCKGVSALNGVYSDRSFPQAELGLDCLHCAITAAERLLHVKRHLCE